MKVCSWCKKEKPLDAFYKNKLTKSGVGAWCRVCDTKNRREDRNSKKIKLVNFFGGKCVFCGYSRCVWALEFHHKDKNKEFGIGGKTVGDYNRLFEEAKKCILICSNCHREIHAGVRREVEDSNL